MAMVVLLSSAGCTGRVGDGARPDEPARTTQPQPRVSTTSVEAKAVLGTTDLAAGGSVAVTRPTVAVRRTIRASQSSTSVPSPDQRRASRT